MAEIWKRPTLGGIQFWTDYRWIAGCRLQCHALTHRWRVLNALNRLEDSGDKAHCEKVFWRSVERESPGIHYDRVTLLMHGLMRTPRSMKGLGQYLHQNGLGIPIAPGYASTRAAIAFHAEAFRQVVEALPGEPMIDVVGHSMGNIVVRHAIKDWESSGNPKGILDRFHRMVMLGPPNRGALIAKRLAMTGIFGLITGKGGLELGPEWASLESRLAIPPFPFAIVAGKIPQQLALNPLIDGAGDFIVTVEETRLEGACETVEFPVTHTFLMVSKAVQQFTAGFLSQD